MRAPAHAEPPMVALVLQGGGALGAYHIGALEALEAAGLDPDWVAGISIGAFNAAIIAGNEPGERLEKLLGFWHEISRPELMGPWRSLPLQLLHDHISSAESMVFGQPHFFSPRLVSPCFLSGAGPEALSFYDTSALYDTLTRFTSFERINRKTTRLTLGATNIATGQLEFFDSETQPIGAAHVIASGSLPPGFPATEIDGKFYWDGACVSNTPLEALAAGQGRRMLLVFLIDLWDAAGALPASMSDVLWRAKQIQYAGRAAHDLKIVATVANYLHAKRELSALPALDGVPDSLRKGRLELVHITYRPGANHIANSDTEFSRSSIAARRAAGRADMERALAAAPWTRPMAADERARVHHVAD